MNRKILIKVIIIAIVSFIVIGFGGKVRATTITVSPSSPKVGDTVKIKVTVPNVNTAKVVANVSGVVSGKITVAGGNLTQEPSTYSAEKSFYCEKEGTINVSISKESSSAVLNGEYVDVGAATSVNVIPKAQNSNENNIPNNDETVEIPSSNTQNNLDVTTNNNISPETKKSNNANLSNLGITPNDFKGFKSATTSYSMAVPNNVEEVKVYATPSDSKATVSGTGTKKLEVGKNTLSVTVTAEDGTQKIYTINVTREEKEATDTTNNTINNETVNNTTENSVSENNISNTKIINSDLAKLEISGFTLTPNFSPDVFEYNLKVNEDVNDIDVKAEGASSDVNIEVVGNTNLQDGENVVTIMVYNKKTDKTTTYQVIVEKTKMEIEEVKYNDAIQKAAKIRRIALGTILFIVVCIIIFVIVKRRANIDQRADKYEYDEEDEAKLNLDEEEEFFNRVNKTKLKKTEKNESDDIEESLPKSIKKPLPKQEFESKLVVNTSEDDEEEEDTPEYFRTSKSGKKGKHF